MTPINCAAQHLVGSTWQTVDDVKWRYDEKAQASVLTITGSGVIDWDDDGDGDRSLALPGGGFSPPDRRMRAADQKQDAPYYNAPTFDCHVTTVRIPTSTRPSQWSSKLGFDTRMFGRTYYRTLDLRDGSIRMIRGSRTELQEIDAASAERDNARIAKFDNSMAWIFYNHGGTDDPISNKTSVPATYEIDWTADDVPCLATKTN